MPYASYSTRFHPAPMPNSNRPPLITSTHAAIFASTDGYLYDTHDTSDPIRSVLVSTARPASAVQHSQQSRSSDRSSRKR